MSYTFKSYVDSEADVPTIFSEWSKTLASPITVPAAAWFKPNLLFLKLIVAFASNPILGVPFIFVTWIELPILIGTLWFSTNLVVLGFKTSRDVVDDFSIS